MTLPPPSPTSPSRFWLGLGSVLLLTTLLYLPALQGELVWDDHFLLTRDPRVTGPVDLMGLLSPYWQNATGQALEGIAYSRPLVTLSFALQHAVTGLAPLPLHLFNLLLHLLNITLLALWIRRDITLEHGSDTAPVLPMLVGVALFALHPTAVEPVAWIAGRTDLLAMGFGLMALLVVPRSISRALLLTLLLLASLLSKEVGAVFGVVVLVRAVLTYAGSPASTTQRDALLPLVPPLLAFFLALTLRAIALGGGENAEAVIPAAPLWVLPLRMATSMGYYLEMFFWPWNPSALAATRALPPPTSPLLWGGFLGLWALGWGVARALRQALAQARNARAQGPDAPQTSAFASPALAWLWVAVGLLPVLNLFPLSAPSPVAERFWYVPLGGVAWGLAQLGIYAQRRLKALPPRPELTHSLGLLGLMGGLLFAGMSLTTALRVPDWHSDHTLWEAEYERHGLRHVLTARNLGAVRQLSGDTAGALQIWQKALETGLGTGTPHGYEIALNVCATLLQKPETRASGESLFRQIVASHPPDAYRERIQELANLLANPSAAP